MPHAGAAAACGTLRNAVSEQRHHGSEKTPVAAPGNQRVNPPFPESGGARREIFMPQRDDSRPKIFRQHELRSQRTEPKCCEPRENSVKHPVILHIHLEIKKILLIIVSRNGDLPKLVRDGSAKASFPGSSPGVASKKKRWF